MTGLPDASVPPPDLWPTSAAAPVDALVDAPAVGDTVVAAAADFTAAFERADAAGLAELCADAPLAVVPAPEGSPVADASAGAAPAAFAAPESPEGAVPVAAPPVPARGETGAESPAPVPGEAASAAADDDAAAAAATAAGDALPSAGKDAPPDAAA